MQPAESCRHGDTCRRGTRSGKATRAATSPGPPAAAPRERGSSTRLRWNRVSHGPRGPSGAASTSGSRLGRRQRGRARRPPPRQVARRAVASRWRAEVQPAAHALTAGPLWHCCHWALWGRAASLAPPTRRQEHQCDSYRCPLGSGSPRADPACSRGRRDWEAAALGAAWGGGPRRLPRRRAARLGAPGTDADLATQSWKAQCSGPGLCSWHRAVAWPGPGCAQQLQRGRDPQPWPRLAFSKSLDWRWLSLGVTLPPEHTGPCLGTSAVVMGVLLASSEGGQGGCSVPTEPWMAPRVTCPLSTVPRGRQTLRSLFIKNLS